MLAVSKTCLMRFDRNKYSVMALVSLSVLRPTGQHKFKPQQFVT